MEPNYDDMSVADLKDAAAAAGIEGRGKMNKADLIAALRAAQPETPAPADEPAAVEPPAEPAAQTFTRVFQTTDSASEDPAKYTAAVKTAAIQQGLTPIGPVTLTSLEPGRHKGYKRMVFSVPVRKS